MLNPSLPLPSRHSAQGEDMSPYLIFSNEMGQHKVDVAGLSDVQIADAIAGWVDGAPKLEEPLHVDVPPIVDGLSHQSYKPWSSAF